MPEMRTDSRQELISSESREKLKRLKDLAELTGEELVNIGSAIGKGTSRSNVSITQLRKFHEHIVRYAINYEAGRTEISNISFLKYHLAYALARVKDKKIYNVLKELKFIYDEAIDRVKTKEDLKRLRQLSEAIVAYHKFYGGKD
jgi:CRISPR-associated protein Csm2